MVLSPALMKVSVHEPLPPLKAAIWQLTPPEPLTVTLPVGVPPYCPATLTATRMDCPTTDASGLSDVIVVVVLALFTVCGAVPELPL